MTDGNILDISSILISAFVQQCSQPFNCGMHPIEDPSGNINTVFCEDGFAYLSPEPPDKLILPEFDRVVHISSTSSRQYQSNKTKNNNQEDEIKKSKSDENDFEKTEENVYEDFKDVDILEEDRNEDKQEKNEEEEINQDLNLNAGNNEEDGRQENLLEIVSHKISAKLDGISEEEESKEAKQDFNEEGFEIQQETNKENENKEELDKIETNKEETSKQEENKEEENVNKEDEANKEEINNEEETNKQDENKEEEENVNKEDEANKEEINNDVETNKQKANDEEEANREKETNKEYEYINKDDEINRDEISNENEIEEIKQLENEDTETKDDSNNEKTKNEEEDTNNDDNKQENEDDKELQILTDELKSLTENVADIIINDFNIEWGIINGQPPYLINCDNSTFVFSDDLMPFSMYFYQILLFIGYESALTVIPGKCITPNKKCIGSQLSVNRQKFEIVQIQKFFQPIMTNSSNSNSNSNNNNPDYLDNDNYSCATENATSLSSDASDKLIQYMIKRLCVLFPQMMMSNVPCCSHCFLIYSRISLSSPTQSTKNAKKPRRVPNGRRANNSPFRTAPPNSIGYSNQSNYSNYNGKSSYTNSRTNSSSKAVERGRQTLQMTSNYRQRNQHLSKTLDDSRFEPFQRTKSGLTVVQNISQQTFKKSYKIYSSNPFPAYMQHP